MKNSSATSETRPRTKFNILKKSKKEEMGRDYQATDSTNTIL